MLKTDAIKLLGGTATSAAAAIGVTPQAVAGWPDELPPRIEDRVLAALYRQQHGDKLPEPVAAPPP
jgi:hypothetical protein